MEKKCSNCNKSFECLNSIQCWCNKFSKLNEIQCVDNCDCFCQECLEEKIENIENK